MKNERTVLLVDDNPSDLLITETVLENHGFSVIGVGSGQEALEVLTQFQFSLFVIDMQMPEMSGLELLIEVCKVDEFKDVPKLMLSASNRLPEVKKAMELGAHDYLTKPIDVDLLEEKLKLLSGNTRDWEELELLERDPVRMGLLIGCELVSISELTGTFKVGSAPQKGSVVTLHLKVPGVFDVGLVNVRVNEVMHQDSEIKIQVSFVGLKEADRSHIRKFCNQLYAEKKQKELL